MLRLILAIAIFSLISCGGKKTETETTSDELMDSTTIQKKGDTTVKMLDNLEDSINKLRNKAADNSGQ